MSLVFLPLLWSVFSYPYELIHDFNACGEATSSWKGGNASDKAASEVFVCRRQGGTDRDTAIMNESTVREPSTTRRAQYNIRAA